jgi:hypothetical protein
MQRNDNNGPDLGAPFKEARQQMQLLVAAVQILSMPLSAFTRRFGTWGERYANHHMAMGWLAIPVFVIFFPQADGRPILWVWFGTAYMLLLHRVRGWRMRLKGYWVPSQYFGQSRIPGDEWKAKGQWEPFLAVVAGMAACLYNPVVGTWLITAGVCQSFAVGLARDQEKAVVRAARDARAQAQYEMDLLRQELGEQ